MKTKLLYVASFILVLFTACSVEENDQLSDQEKDLKVKSLIKSFKQDVIPSTKFTNFISDFQSKSTPSLTQEQLEQEFLSLQSPEFVELYYFVDSLNLTEEEIRMIIIEFLASSAKKNISSTEFKTDADECTYGESPGGIGLLWAIIAKILCEEDRSTDD